MISSQSSNHRFISHTFPQKQILYSSLDLKRLACRRSLPKSMEFKLEESIQTTTNSLKKLITSVSKTTFKLRNPPTRVSLNNGSLTKNLRSLEVKPEQAAKYITEITHKFSKVRHFAILDEQDTFVPMRIRKKVSPMRSLKRFAYDHEFCKDFIRCARYATELKIRKTSLDLNHLKRLERLEKLHLILKTKYLSLPEEDVKFRDDLGKTLDKLPVFGKIVLEQDVDPETCPYTFMELQKILKGKTRTHLIADFIDVSGQRNKNLSIEKMLPTIHDLGIESLKLNYVGVAQPMNRFGRSFYAPLHIKPEDYVRFLKTLMATPFKNVEFAPIIHSAYLDCPLKDSLLELKKPDPKLNISRLNIIYNLDMLDKTDLLEDLYDQRASYEMTITSTKDLRRGLVEKLEGHFSTAFSKMQEMNADLSIQFVVKNNETLVQILDVIKPQFKNLNLKTLGIQIQDPISSDALPSLLETISSSGISRFVKDIEVDLTQKAMPQVKELSQFLRGIVKLPRRLNKMTLMYHNTEECERALQEVFETLRSEKLRTQLEYEINNERSIIE